MSRPGQPGQPGQSGHAPSPPPRAGGAQRLQAEGTKWSWGLVGFYVSCACVALGATVAAAGKMWFGSNGAMVFGIVLTAVSTVTCFVTLSAARKG